MIHISYIGGYGECGHHMHIDLLERRVGLGYRYVNGFGLLVYTVSTKELKNKVLNL